MLVDYSDSDDEERITSHASTALPSLPSTFLDLYSSTVRASTQDDPSLHGGRIRAIPHTAGNWPAHVYLEWSPTTEELKLLSAALEDVKNGSSHRSIHSLLNNSLGVNLPLHISLSRPLVLKTVQKDDFLARIRPVLLSGNSGVIHVAPRLLRWHLSEDSSRDFLVLQLDNSTQLSVLLQRCNRIAQEFDQPMLYASKTDDQQDDQFHISIAWALPASRDTRSHELDSPAGQQLASLRLAFDDVKVRLGQDVMTIPLVKLDTNTTSLFS